MTSSKTNIFLSAIDSHESFKSTWNGDSEVSCQYCISDEGLFDQIKMYEMITVRIGRIMKTEKVGKLGRCVLKFDGRKFEITLENVKIVPDIWINSC
jgi:hypothetical protein